VAGKSAPNNFTNGQKSNMRPAKDRCGRWKFLEAAGESVKNCHLAATGLKSGHYSCTE
jgi:hypothetical protein